MFAETKIVSGLGDAEKWYSLLPPADYQQLKERIDLDFAYTNKTELAPGDPVALDLYVKNVDTLIVKVFEINTQNFYRQHLKEIGTDINLDGLVANEEKTYTYQEPPLRRVPPPFRVSQAEQAGRLRGRLHRQRQSQPGPDPQRQAALHCAHQRRRPGVYDLGRTERTRARRDLVAGRHAVHGGTRTARSRFHSRISRAASRWCSRRRLFFAGNVPAGNGELCVLWRHGRRSRRVDRPPHGAVDRSVRGCRWAARASRARCWKTCG